MRDFAQGRDESLLVGAELDWGGFRGRQSGISVAAR